MPIEPWPPPGDVTGNELVAAARRRAEQLAALPSTMSESIQASEELERARERASLSSNAETQSDLQLARQQADQAARKARSMLRVVR